MNTNQPLALSRRELLASTLLAGMSGALPGMASDRPEPEQPKWQKAVLAYLQTLARPDGGFAWADQPQSHLTPTFAVVGCYHLLKQAPPDRAKVADFVRNNHPFKLKKLEREMHYFEFQQIQSLLWLGEDCAGLSGAGPHLEEAVRLRQTVRKIGPSHLPLRIASVHLPGPARPAAGRSGR